jgi:hypothetical protein
MTKLHIADNLALPIEAVTQTFGILAKKGAGKTYTAAVMAEEMLKASQPVVVIDPTGAWWGLRSGYPVAVFGGDHADVPLEESAGEVIASAVVANRFPAILDLSLLRKAGVRRFLTPFLEALYRLNREPLHLFVDEADDVAPQQPRGDEAPLLGAMEDVVKRGRRKGIGCTLITQRPADLAKQVLTQVEVLTVLRLSHPRDLAAIREWVNVHADPEQAKDMMDSLPSLPVGTAWFWSPGWLDLFAKVKVRRRETFDSSATPKPGEKVTRPKTLAEIDLAALGEQIAATVQRAKENDPAALKRRVAELEKLLRERPAEVREVERVVEVPVLQNGQLDRTEAIVARVEAEAGRLAAEAAELRRLIGQAAAPRPTASPRARPSPATAQPRPKPAPRPAAEPAEGLSGPQQRILDALAWLESVRVSQAKRTQVALLAEQSPTSSAYANNLGALRTAGLIDYPGPGLLALTDAGRAAAHPLDVPPTTEALHEAIYARLPGPQGRILQALVAAYPAPVGREALAEESGQSATSSAYANNLGALRSLGLIDYPQKGQGAALPVLFLEG